MGVAFALVGAAVIAGIVYPGDTPTVKQSSSADVVDLPGGQWRSFLLPAVGATPATLTISWTASAAVNVSWYAVRACNMPTGTCVVTPPLKAWVENLSGRWSATGSAGTLYELLVYSAVGHNTTVDFSGTFTEQYRTGPLTLPMLPFLLTMAGGSLLAGVGAVALYLGLFLPSGVFAPFDRPPPATDDVPAEPLETWDEGPPT